MSLTINHQTDDISNLTGAVTFNGVAVGGDNSPVYWYGSRGLWGGGVTIDTINYVTIQTTGNATDFGNLTVARYFVAGCSNGSRGVFGGGEQSSGDNVTIDYVTVASTGNATDFGDLTTQRGSLGSCSDGSRGLFGGGSSDNSNVIDYITIASEGNATDFGDLVTSGSAPSACSDSTRGVFAGHVNRDDMYYVTIQTTGNAALFGDLTGGRRGMGAASSTSRGVFSGGEGTAGLSGRQNIIDYITIQTTGNATDFGDLTVVRYYVAGCSDASRAVFGGGRSSTNLDVLDYITIDTTGNATDFGDLTESMWGPGSCSGT